MSERVDKKWADKGLTGYSNEAILGTLQHYGVSCDEAAFRAQAEQAYPLGIAMGWMEKWKGTGQFARFPPAAAEMLWRRWLPDRPTPGEFIEAHAGEREPALQRLEEVAKSGPLSARRLVATDALLHLRAMDRARHAAEALLDEAEREQDFHLGLDVCARLQHLYKQQQDVSAQFLLQQRASRLEEAHARAHPGHVHAHRH
jgi:hypothetical protein